MLRAGDLSANIIDFCGLLRRELNFLVGHAEARDALRAVEVVGVADHERVRSALRLTLCTKPSELEIFNEAFDAFFLHPERGAKQSSYAPKHTRAQQSTASTEPSLASDDRAAGKGDAGEHDQETAQKVQPARADYVEAAEEADTSQQSAEALRAHYSPQAEATQPPAIAGASVRSHLAAANDLVNSVRLGRLRRWKPTRTGLRFDMRRTLRTSLHTGGDPVALRFLGHPLRNPRFVLLIDGSRSMSSYGSLMLEFAYALVRRSRRASVFVFSTQLRDVTSELSRSARLSEHRLTGVGEAWGGGTRIGASLKEFLHVYGPRHLSDETVAIIYSDGLDVGDLAQLERTMHEIHGRSAAVIWLNPLIGTPDYMPTARGMQVALRHVDAFIGLKEAAGLSALARHAAAATRK